MVRSSTTDNPRNTTGSPLLPPHTHPSLNPPLPHCTPSFSIGPHVCLSHFQLLSSLRRDQRAEESLIHKALSDEPASKSLQQHAEARDGRISRSVRNLEAWQALKPPFVWVMCTQPGCFSHTHTHTHERGHTLTLPCLFMRVVLPACGDLLCSIYNCFSV